MEMGVGDGRHYERVSTGEEVDNGGSVLIFEWRETELSEEGCWEGCREGRKVGRKVPAEVFIEGRWTLGPGT